MPDLTSPLQSFFEKIKTISFQRLFTRKEVRTQLADASSLGSTIKELDILRSSKSDITFQLSECCKDLQLPDKQKAKQETAQKRFEELIAKKGNQIEYKATGIGCNKLDTEIGNRGIAMEDLSEELNEVRVA